MGDDRLGDDFKKVTCSLTACTPGSAPGSTLGNNDGRTLPSSHKSVNCFVHLNIQILRVMFEAITRRTQGRPRTTWLYSINDDLSSFGMELSEATAATECQPF